MTCLLGSPSLHVNSPMTVFIGGNCQFTRLAQLMHFFIKFVLCLLKSETGLALLLRSRLLELRSIFSYKHNHNFMRKLLYLGLE